MSPSANPSWWSRVPRNLLRETSWTAIWQVGGKLIQIFALGYAVRCLEGGSFGISEKVIARATMLQVVLTLGMDVVAVRHVAARTHPLAAFLPAIFTFRLMLHGLLAAVWAAAAFLIPLAPSIRWIWLLGSAYFFMLGMNFQWYYQAVQRMPSLSRLQTLTTLTVGLCFFLFFRPGQAGFSYLLVLVTVHGTVTVWVWKRVRQEQRVSLWDARWWSLIKPFLKEGRANWVFGVTYNLLTLMGMILVADLVPAREREAQGDYYASAYKLVLTLQIIFTYLGYVFYPRIVRWRRELPRRFFKRVSWLAFGVATAGVACSLLLIPIAKPLFILIFEPRLTPGAQILPVMVFGKFASLASGLLVWGLFAHHRDWTAVVCCMVPVGIMLIFHLLLVPRFGFIAAGWLYGLGELLLLLCCWIALRRTETQRNMPHEEPTETR